MKTKKYFIVPVFALLAAGCQDDLQEGGGTAQPGKEVTFGATLSKSTAATRTSYGSYDEDNGYYPIYWKNGDLVIVTSPDCKNGGGVGSATYSVSVESTTQSYATDLTKTGSAGVQWGENTTGTFYSVYPASEDDVFGSDLTTVTLDMSRQQNCTVTDDNSTVNPDMDACFMYAKTANVTAGETVYLKYIPISTAIRFNLQGPSTTSADEVMIQNIYFYAPSNTAISGKFTVDLDNDNLDSDSDGQADQVPTLSRVTDSWSNYVEVNAIYETKQYLTLKAGDKVEMNVFLLLEEEVEVGDGWSIVITTTNGTTYTKTLELDGDNKLVPGKVHRLPDLPNLDDDAEWKVSNWMTYLPRNVYLSEISIPGSWNSMNYYFQPSGRQNTATSIEDQYNAGARAFHIDTRWKGSLTRNWLFISNGYNVTELGVADGSTSDAPALNNEGRIMVSSTSPTFASVLSTITSCVQDDEYMVVYCTFAQDSYDHDRSNGGWENAVSEVCANNTSVIDAKNLNENSVVADVLGKVIVIINTNENVSSLDLSNSRCLFMTDMGMTLDESTYKSENYTSTALAYGSGSTCVTAYGTHAQVTANGDSGYDTGDRGYAPTLTERETKVGNILSWSQANHQSENYAHDTWFYLGLGGYTADSDGDETGDDPYGAVAEELNPWINTQIANMKTSSYYPVGIVLMNDVINYSTVMENILKLNNTYSKAYDENRSSTTGDPIDGTTTKSVSSVATGYSSGMKDYNTNVISWD